MASIRAHRDSHAPVPGHPRFHQAVITAGVPRIDAEMVHGKLFIVGSPGIVIDTDGLNRMYSKVKLRSTDAAADPLRRIKIAGTLVQAKVIERRR